MNNLQKRFIESVGDATSEMLLLNEITEAMNNRLTEKRTKEGRHGWHTQLCNNNELMLQLIANVKEGDMIGVINFAAMIHCRNKLYGESVEKPTF